jgi:O-antigen/teichoic acid export membrane protein
MRIDNLIIENHLGLEQLALYAAVNSLAFMFPILTGSIMKFLLREVSKEGISYLIRITEIQKKYFPFLFLGILILALTSKPLIWIVYGNKFIEAVPVFVILMASYLGGVFFTPLESYFYGFHQKTILGLKLLQLCVLIIMALVLINKFRLIGIALAVLASRLTGWVILYYKSIKEIKKLA